MAEELFQLLDRLIESAPDAMIVRDVDGLVVTAIRDATRRTRIKAVLRILRSHLAGRAARQTAELERLKDELRDVEEEAIEIGERERRRLGRELHDGLGQHLTGIAFMARALTKKLAASSPEDAMKVRQMEILIGQANRQMRNLAKGLYPAHLDRPLPAALAELAESIQEQFGVQCRFEHDGQVVEPDRSVSLHLYRIVQEAISNAIKHGRAGRIVIRLGFHRDRIVLIVEDNGSGLPEGSLAGPGLGLRIMQHRAALLGAKLEIEPGPDRGARISCRLHARPIRDLDGGPDEGPA